MLHDNPRANPRNLCRCFWLVLVFVLSQNFAVAQDEPKVPVPEFAFLPPEEVSVFPVFFVASDQPVPPSGEAVLLQKHLKAAQRWYRQQLRGVSTFRIYSEKAYLFRARHPLAYYVSQKPGKRAPVQMTELLDHFKLTRFNCPFIFVVIVDRMDERPPGGRPMNSGFNGGGGIVQMARKGLTGNKAFQGILRHELGHSFGLQHVALYGYDMKTNLSVMSYNGKSRPKVFTESRTPQVLIPEDIRALSFNDRVFPKLTFEPQKHIPRGYQISPKMNTFRPIPLPDHPADHIEIVSLSGESVRSKAKNLVRKKIVPNERSTTNKQGTNYDKTSMWHSDDTKTKWRSLEITFPVNTTLTAIRVHSQHSGKVHPVKAFQTTTLDGANETLVVEAKVTDSNQLVTFSETASRRWRLDFQPGQSGKVALRGLQFYFRKTELYAAITSDEDAVPNESD